MTPIPSQPLPLEAVRTLALHAQGLAARPAESPSLDTIYQTVDRLGCVQIDTLHLVRRSQYLVLWSRLGTYDPADFERLIYDPVERRLFEYWKHAASIIPLHEYRYYLRQMRHYANGGWWPEWAKQPDNRALIEDVLRRIRQEGAQRVSDFEYDGPARGAWWDWKPAKRALEYLYNAGELMIADRVNFHRVYDVRERVLPDWVDTTLPTAEETRRYHLERGALAFGIFQPGQAADYTHMKRGDAAPVLKQMIADGVLVEVQGELAGGKTGTLLLHRDTLPLVEQVMDGAIRAEHTTFLSPFDSLFWPHGRDEAFWGFQQRLEAYKPAPQRIWGYFCLPILWRGQLVGRFDPKLERKAGTLRLKALYLEPGVAPSEQLVADVAEALRDFIRFHEAHDLIIERSDPAEFGEKLRAVL